MSGDAQFVEVTYRGLKLAARARMSAVDGAWFVEHEAPLPVGSALVVHRGAGDPIEARVVGVVEQEAGAKSPPGMRVSFGDALPVPATARAPERAPAAREPPERDPAAPEPADSTQRTEIMMVPQIDPDLLAGDTTPGAGEDLSGPVDKDDPDKSSPGDDKGKRGRRGRRKPNGR